MLELLKKLNTEVSFRPDAGEFLSKLIELAIENAEEERTELFSAHNCDVQVSFSRRTIEEGTIRFLVVSDLGNQSLKCDLAALNDKETRDLAGQLSRSIAEQSPPETPEAQKIIVRKYDTGMLDTHQAAQKLGCSQIFLKSKIPCTDYTYREVDGKKEIIEYYWSKSLIDRLSSIKLKGVKTEDVENIAEECCDGDFTWAEEVLLSLGCTKSTPKTPKTPLNVIIKPPDKTTPKIITKRWHSRKKNP